MPVFCGKDEFVELLKSYGLKITPQRLEILRYLDKNMTHPTANEIYTALKKKNPSLSKTTVYNSLETLSKNEIVIELTISKTESRYDLKRRMHHHFLCKNCNKIIDIDVQCPFLGEMLDCNYKIEEVHGYFKGLCEDCMKTEKENQ